MSDAEVKDLNQISKKDIESQSTTIETFDEFKEKILGKN